MPTKPNSDVLEAFKMLIEDSNFDWAWSMDIAKLAGCTLETVHATLADDRFVCDDCDGTMRGNPRYSRNWNSRSV